MNRLRISLLLLALMALLLCGTLAFAGTGDSGPSSTAASFASPGPEAGQCQAPKPSLGAGVPAMPLDDFILCSCQYCQHHPNDICRISPTGFSIVCSDYSQTHC